MSASETPPKGLKFEPSNDALPENAATWVRVPDDYPCGKCRERGGWMPRVWASSCPVCWGEDPYGDNSYCGECDYCCGC